LCEKNPDKTLYPASTTKIMTAILALENGDLKQEMAASQAAIDDIGPGGSNIGIIPGEKIPLENLLQALLITSANESANIIAENLRPSRQDFIDLMNKKAKELGATGTHFANTNGYHNPEHYTTASDMAKFARYAMTFPKFREIVSTRTFKMPSTNKHPDWPVLSNTNKLMISDKNDLYVIDGIKTGFTGQAGFNLVSSARDSSGMELISVVMAVKNDDAQENVKKYSKELLDYGFNNFKQANLVEKGKVYRNVKVEDATDIYGLDLLTTEDLTCVLPAVDSFKHIKEIPHIRDNLTAPINKGDIIGNVEFLKDNVSIGKVDLVAARDIAQKPEPVTIAKSIKGTAGNIYVKIVIIFIGLIIFLIILRSILRFISRRLKRRRY
jgi:D-alanyl-D-alanine carboxypeptidase/D-alanyl-D-alanine carboxypeptidase (penicillin-binding protein 5/6)